MLILRRFQFFGNIDNKETSFPHGSRSESSAADYSELNLSVHFCIDV